MNEVKYNYTTHAAWKNRRKNMQYFCYLTLGVQVPDCADLTMSSMCLIRLMDRTGLTAQIRNTLFSMCCHTHVQYKLMEVIEVI